MESIKDTRDTYSLLWENSGNAIPPKWHFNTMQEVIDEPIVRGSRGIEVGSGCGFDSFIMAKNNPSFQLVSMDISDGVYSAARLTGELKNVSVLRASSLDLPFRQETFDFCYSYGVIHHTPDPARCFDEIRRVLKKDGRIYLYLYEDHSDNVWKKYPVKAAYFIRKLTSMLNKRLLYFLCMLMSPAIFLIFTVPSKILKCFSRTRRIADQMPFNFGTHPFSLRWDLYDRFGAPIEFRFNRENLKDMLEKSGFTDAKFTKLKTSAGLVVWARLKR